MKPGKSGSIWITPINLYWTSLRGYHLISQVFFLRRGFFIFYSLFSSSLCIVLIPHFQIHNLVTNSHCWLGMNSYSSQQKEHDVQLRGRSPCLAHPKIHFLPVLVHLNVYTTQVQVATCIQSLWTACSLEILVIFFFLVNYREQRTS